ncbi:MFS transporter [Candidatus Acidianus copahuensis]|uniref:MFS transporter n=1 Tax=Candidatus Acidianus copahuensis TaxID=1160895 RepID=A0A031LHG0_9CREN|nr:MFS transporter [Candidatus Acidianus copahuensis]EZQ01592.1 MFS transporter [Candidatus Acidianus copahuensis]
MQRDFYRYVAVLAGISILTMYVEMVVLPSLPKIEKQFDITEAESSWILSSETLAGMVFAPLLGKLADTRGRKNILMYILIVYTISVSFTSFAPNFSLLLLARTVQGLGLSINPLSYTLLREKLSDRELPIAQGIIASTFAVGAAIALPIGSYIAQFFSWEVAYQTAIPFLIIVSIIAYKVLPSSSYLNKGSKIDIMGLFLLSLGFLVFGIGVTEAPNWGWTSIPFILTLIISFISLFMFVRHIGKVSTPLIDPDDFKNPNIAVPLLSSFVTGFGLFLTFQSLIFLFELPKPVGYGMTIFETGLTLAPIALVMLVGGPLFGKLVQVIGYKKIIISASVLSLITILILASVVTLDISVDELMTILIFTLLFVAGMNVTRVTLLVASSSKRRMATITGTNTAMRLMGNAIGPIVAGSLEDTFKTPLLVYMYNQIPIFTFIPSRYSFEYSFFIAAITVLAVIILATKIKEIMPTNEIKLSGQ